MDDQTLTLPLTEETARRLKALAVLLGPGSAQDLQEELSNEVSELVDIIVRRKIREAVPVVEPDQTHHHEAPTKKEGFADLLKKAAGARTEEQEDAPVVDEVSGHELSGDEDKGDTKSLAEQYEDVSQSPVDDGSLENLFRKSDANIERVGDDVEAFLDATLGSPNPEDDYGQEPFASTASPTMETARKASKTFEGRRMRGGPVGRVSFYSGDE